MKKITRAATLTARSPEVRRGDRCKHCGCSFRPGDQALLADLGQEAPWDQRYFGLHFRCVRNLTARLRPITPPDRGRSDKADAFRAQIDRIRAGGPILELAG